MKRFLLAALVLAALSSPAFSESRTPAQTWLAYSNPVKKATINGYFLAIEYISDGLEEVARRFMAEHSIKASAKDPPGAPAEKHRKHDMDGLVRAMDAFYRRPGHEDVPLKVALKEACIPKKEKKEDNAVR